MVNRREMVHVELLDGTVDAVVAWGYRTMLSGTGWSKYSVTVGYYH